MFKSIKLESGRFEVYEEDEQGNNLRVIPETFATQEAANECIKALEAAADNSGNQDAAAADAEAKAAAEKEAADKVAVEKAERDNLIGSDCTITAEGDGTLQVDPANPDGPLVCVLKPVEPHIATQEDLDTYPALVEAGVNVGDEVTPWPPVAAE